MISPAVLRTYKTVHTWTGIITGLALFIAFYAGAITVFKEPLTRWASAPTVAPVSVPLDAAPALITETLRTHPEAARDFSLPLRQTEAGPGPLVWQVDPHLDHGHPSHSAMDLRHFVATPQADGTVQVIETYPSKLAEFIDVLHRVVGLPVDTEVTRWVMGVIAGLYALALVSGVILLVPTLARDLFALRPGKSLRLLWRDAHNVVGLFSLPFHLVMALTAAVFAFHDGLYTVQDKVIHQGHLAAMWGARPAPSASAAPRDPAAMMAPADLLARVEALAPTFTPIRLQYLGVTGPRAVVRVWGHDVSAIEARTAGGFVALDPYSGRMLMADYLPGHQTAALTTISSFFAAHFGTFGGAPVQALYFVLGLAGAWLFYSGNLLWLESRRKMQRPCDGGGEDGGEDGNPVQRRDVRVMAALTVGVCLGCVSGLSLTIAAGKWLHDAAGPTLPLWHQLLYYAVFFGAIAWAVRRGAGRAAVELSWLAVVATAAIPATTLLAWSMPSLGLWGHTSVAALGVDLVAVVGAVCFGFIARATTRRVRHGPADSVWSAQAATVCG